jgi:glycine dehydrogenase subunit 1
MREDRILAGLDLTSDYPELGPALLVCTTETKQSADLEQYAQTLSGALTAIQRETAGSAGSVR